jgi:hypothetical protein
MATWPTSAEVFEGAGNSYPILREERRRLVGEDVTEECDTILSANIIRLGRQDCCFAVK